MGIVNNTPQEYLVVIQINFRCMAMTEQQAEGTILRAISVGAPALPGILNIATHSEPITDRKLQELGISTQPGQS